MKDGSNYYANVLFSLEYMYKEIKRKKILEIHHSTQTVHEQTTKSEIDILNIKQHTHRCIMLAMVKKLNSLKTKKILFIILCCHTYLF